MWILVRLVVELANVISILDNVIVHTLMMVMSVKLPLLVVWLIIKIVGVMIEELVTKKQVCATVMMKNIGEINVKMNISTVLEMIRNVEAAEKVSVKKRDTVIVWMDTMENNARLLPLIVKIQPPLVVDLPQENA